MNKNILATIALAILLSACDSETNSASPQPAATAVADTAPAPAPSAPGAVLMGAYTPAFAHRVRSQRHEALGDGKYQHVVIVEYMDMDEQVVGETLSRELAGRGLNVKGPMERNGAQRYLAQNSKVGQMYADVNSKSALELSPGARGIIYFSWQDGEAR